MTGQVHGSLEMQRDFHQVMVTKWPRDTASLLYVGFSSPECFNSYDFLWDFIFVAGTAAVVHGLRCRACLPMDTLPSGCGGNSQLRLGRVPRAGRGRAVKYSSDKRDGPK